MNAYEALGSLKPGEFAEFGQPIAGSQERFVWRLEHEVVTTVDRAVVRCCRFVVYLFDVKVDEVHVEIIDDSKEVLWGSQQQSTTSPTH